MLGRLQGLEKNLVLTEQDIEETLDPKTDDLEDYVHDFEKSDAPQFKGKSKKKKAQMAYAAYKDAQKNEDVKVGVSTHIVNSEEETISEMVEKIIYGEQ